MNPHGCPYAPQTYVSADSTTPTHVYGRITALCKHHYNKLNDKCQSGHNPGRERTQVLWKLWNRRYMLMNADDKNNSIRECGNLSKTYEAEA